MANIFTQNPMRIDTAMANDYLTTIGASAVSGLRPIKIVSIRVDNPTPTAGTQVITDGAATPSTIYDVTLPATIGSSIDNRERLWRNFKITAVLSGAVIWIERR